MRKEEIVIKYCDQRYFERKSLILLYGFRVKKTKKLGGNSKEIIDLFIKVYSMIVFKKVSNLK